MIIMLVLFHRDHNHNYQRNTQFTSPQMSMFTVITARVDVWKIELMRTTHNALRDGNLAFFEIYFSSKNNISVFQFTPDPTHSHEQQRWSRCQLCHFCTNSTPVMTVDLLLWLNSVDVQQMLIGHRRSLWSVPKTCQIRYTTCLLKVSVSFSTEYLLSKFGQLFFGEIN